MRACTNEYTYVYASSRSVHTYVHSAINVLTYMLAFMHARTYVYDKQHAYTYVHADRYRRTGLHACMQTARICKHYGMHVPKCMRACMHVRIDRRVFSSHTSISKG